MITNTPLLGRQKIPGLDGKIKINLGGKFQPNKQAWNFSMKCSSGVAFLIFSLLASWASSAELQWPGLPPDCWSNSRIVNGIEKYDLWEKNSKIVLVKSPKPEKGVVSPNGSYLFSAGASGSIGKVTIYAENDYLIQVNLSEIYAISDEKWVNENLVYFRVWWGRVAATDVIYNVETKKVVFKEDSTESTIAYQQYVEDCKNTGDCKCIKKTKNP